MPGVAERAALEPAACSSSIRRAIELLADRGQVGLREDVLDGVVGGGDHAVDDLRRVVVAELDALEVEDRQPAEPGELARQPDVGDGVHRRGEDGRLERDAAEVWATTMSAGSTVSVPGASETSSNP